MCYVYNIFTVKYKYWIIIGSNLNLQFKLIFCLPIIINNNILLKICYENIIKIL